MFATNFAGYECRVQIGKYADGAIRLDLVSEEGPIATATAFIGGGLGDGEVAVKTWSENVGMDLALLLAGVIHARCCRQDPLRVRRGASSSAHSGRSQGGGTLVAPQKQRPIFSRWGVFLWWMVRAQLVVCSSTRIAHSGHGRALGSAGSASHAWTLRRLQGLPVCSDNNCATWACV